MPCLIITYNFPNRQTNLTWFLKEIIGQNLTKLLARQAKANECIFSFSDHDIFSVKLDMFLEACTDEYIQHLERENVCHLPGVLAVMSCHVSSITILSEIGPETILFFCTFIINLNKPIINHKPTKHLKIEINDEPQRKKSPLLLNIFFIAFRHSLFCISAF